MDISLSLSLPLPSLSPPLLFSLSLSPSLSIYFSHCTFWLSHVFHFYLGLSENQGGLLFHVLMKSDLGPDKQGKLDHINRMITLSVITISGFHCIRNKVKTSQVGPFVCHTCMYENIISAVGAA